MSGSRTQLSRSRRVVVKVGTAVLTDGRGLFDRAHFAALVGDLIALARGRELMVVTSGAIALGMERLGLSKRPTDIPGKQAAAACGQSRLMQAYDLAFEAQGITVAQLLLTHGDVADRKRYLNARRALEELLAHGVVPIINENDTVAVDELRFGDNDALAALVAGLCLADLLVILSDVSGLYDRDPRSSPEAQLIDRVERVTPEMEKAAGGSISGVGTGGMSTKVQAAKRGMEVGCQVVIASGKEPGILRQIIAGDGVGTWFRAQGSRLSSRQTWLVHATKPKGLLQVDAGAQAALTRGKRSLLPSGILEVEGAFQMGDAVNVAGPDGRPFARALAGYSADELRKIKGCKTAEIEGILGYRSVDEAVHRDDLALLGDAETAMR